VNLTSGPMALFLLAAGLAAAAAALRWAVPRHPADSEIWDATKDLSVTPSTGMFRAFDDVGHSRWQRRLEWLEGDTAAFSTTAYPRLVLLVDQTLLLRHGIRRGNEPQQARQLLGEQLWKLLEQPPARAPNPGQLAALVERIENI
jgi:hypothetical protein